MFDGHAAMGIALNAKAFKQIDLLGRCLAKSMSGMCGHANDLSRHHESLLLF
jgi:hypothetical protein